MFRCFFSAEADVEFKSMLNGRGMSDTEIAGLEPPSSMITSMEEYVRNVLR